MDEAVDIATQVGQTLIFEEEYPETGWDILALPVDAEPQGGWMPGSTATTSDSFDSPAS